MVSCLGHDYEPVLEAIQQGRSGVRSVPEAWLGRGLKSLVAGTIEDLEFLGEINNLWIPVHADQLCHLALQSTGEGTAH